MALSVRNMITILITVVVLLGVFFTATLYYPTQKKARRVARSRAILEAQVDALSPTRGQTGEETAVLGGMEMDVNFFKRRDLSPREGIPDLLEQINKIGNEINIRFVTVKPLEGEETAQYRKYPFLIESQAGYPELVNFVHRIEEGLHLSINDLKIETDEKDALMHHLQQL